MMPLTTRVEYVTRAAAALDPWTRLTIRDRLCDAAYGRDPMSRHLLTAAAAWLAAVSETGEQVSLDAGPMYLMPPEPQAFAGSLAHCDDLEVLRSLVGVALVESDHAVDLARDWWQAFAAALAAAAAAIEDTLNFGTDLDLGGLE